MNGSLRRLLPLPKRWSLSSLTIIFAAGSNAKFPASRMRTKDSPLEALSGVDNILCTHCSFSSLFETQGEFNEVCCLGLADAGSLDVVVVGLYYIPSGSLEHCNVLLPSAFQPTAAMPMPSDFAHTVFFSTSFFRSASRAKDSIKSLEHA